MASPNVPACCRPRLTPIPGSVATLSIQAMPLLPRPSMLHRRHRATALRDVAGARRRIPGPERPGNNVVSTGLHRFQVKAIIPASNTRFRQSHSRMAKACSAPDLVDTEFACQRS